MTIRVFLQDRDVKRPPREFFGAKYLAMTLALLDHLEGGCEWVGLHHSHEAKKFDERPLRLEPVDVGPPVSQSETRPTLNSRESSLLAL